MEKLSLIMTDWGTVAAVWSSKGLLRLSFPRPDRLAAMRDAGAGPDMPVEDGAEADRLATELDRYFKGRAADFTTVIDWTGYTPFQAAVLRRTMEIPAGGVMTYGEVAAAIGSPRAARAVGGALHINRTPVIVPCHRVIGSDGSLTGFGGGLELKKALLLLERIDS